MEREARALKNLIDERIKEHETTIRWLIEQTGDVDLRSGIASNYIGAIIELKHLKQIFEKGIYVHDEHI